MNHTFNGDEAGDTLSVYESANFPSQFWGVRFYAHPPAYLAAGLGFAKLTSAGKRDIALFLELLSILCSLGTVVMVFLCGQDWFDDRVGLAAAFLYAILPAARVFDTFVKQDAMMVFFVMAFLFFFFKKKAPSVSTSRQTSSSKGNFSYVISAVFLGLAFLTKEPAFFIPLAVGAFLLVSKRFRELLWLVLATLVAGLMSFWWYAFYSVSTGHFLDFFMGKGLESTLFHKPWYHYLVRIPYQVGWVVVVLCLVAVGLFIYKFAAERKGMVPFLIIWIVVTYLIFSVSYGKPPWIITISLPPFALLGAWGLTQVWDRVRVMNKKAALAIVACVLALALGLSLAVSYNRYMYQVDAEDFRMWVTERKMADYLNGWSPGSIMMYKDDDEPVLFYYLDSYDYGHLGYLPASAPVDAYPADKSVVLLEDKTGYQRFLERLATVRPEFALVRKEPAEPSATVNLDRTPLIDAIEKYLHLEKVRFDEAYIFRSK